MHGEENGLTNKSRMGIADNGKQNVIAIAGGGGTLGGLGVGGEGG